MTDPMIKEILDKVVALKGDLENATVNVKNVDMQKMTEEERKEADKKKREEEEKLRKEGKPVPEDPIVAISKFKASLIEAEPRVLTERHLPSNFITKFDEMHQELKKELSSELIEAAGLDGLGAAVEKFHENNEEKWSYLGLAIAGILAPLAIGGLVIVFSKWMLELFRMVQSWVLPGRRVVTLNERQDGFQRLTRQQIRTREDAALGVTQVEPRNPAELEPLKEALGQLNRRIINFNKAIGKMKSKAQLEKLAKGVQAVTKATDDAKPTDIETLATAIGKLGAAQDTFDPKKLPKARGLASAATEAERLAKAGDAVKQAFDELKAAASQAEAVIARS
ncbi:MULTISPECIES: hypothetical protein [Streptomyces]|uniref:Uncharacterized protein n=1 Tax=Streptomyces venezuelae TaxID=54571 RepID=A0A5P2AS09_STRVZ|nr:hypothetical protein [Streptomyces venezuelae]QES20400.1 hypothetical protein DEJ46_15790 [Streptomyces venezuelae]